MCVHARSSTRIMQSFLRHFAALFPALSSPNAVTAAREFSHRSIEEQEKVPLPALAVFLMIIAIGKNCDLDTIASAHTSPESSHGAGAVAGKSSKGRDISTKTVTIDSDLEADLFLSATYQSLRLCSFLSSPTLQTIHAQLLIGAYLMNTERISTYWPLLGSISRQAQSIGLHIDPSRSRIQYDPVEADMRRRLWWTIVHQDCILSSIFGRPLAISKFSCQKPGTIQEPALRTYSRLQCEFAELQRVYLDEAQDRSWSQEQCESYTRKMLDWYENLPSQYRLDFGDLENLESDPDHQLPVKFPEACLGNGDKGLTTLHQSCVFATKLHYILLSLHKSNLVPPDARRQKGNLVINDFSLKMCARSLRVIARTQKVMHDHLGSTRAGMFWSVAFYVFHAAVAGAYITFLMPTSRMSSVVYKDMVSITKSFERAPERWPGLRTAKGGLRVLRKLATAAMNNPRAARKSKASDRKQDLKAPVPRSSRTEETPSPSSASQVQTGSTPTMNTFLNFNSENINNMLENGFSTVSNPTSSAPAGNGEVAVFAGVGGNGNPFNSNLVSPGSALPDSFFAFDPTFSDQFDPLNMMSTPGDLGAGGTNSNHYASNNHNNGSGSSSSRDLGHSSALPTLNVPTANQSTAMSSSSFFQTHPNLIGNLFSSVNVENAEDGPSSVTNGFNESGGGVGGGITGSAFEAIGSRTSVMTDSYGPMVVPQGTNGLSSDPKDMLAYWSDYFSLQLDIDLDSLSNFV
ncbi:hypothetical protein IE53DRAFT_95150 [Violaceomyces palustris]|uniref:Uncharacterized protein n=1 Tax=Violaceomyces palustris TaxID=1673888 RepID=A0ACD0NXG1_9BASI|nr:hypothetical protein IE53DRAFT_95150 [Violaceomyces palustris]